jgi:NNP family nitrate/nitrite transporter-like MFS transporter
MWFSTIDFTLLFAVWLQLGILSIPIRQELNLSNTQVTWLMAVAILNGAFWRLLFGIWADRFGARPLMIALMAIAAVASWLLSLAQTFEQMLAASFLVGIAGNAFSIGVSWNSAWFPKSRQGTALGLFGAGNVGASVTKLIGPLLIAIVPAAGYWGGWIQGGWRFVPQMYSAILVLMIVLTLLFTPWENRRPGQGRTIRAMLTPLRKIRVWRFSLYYVVVFGAYVALSVVLPRYYVDVYGLPLSKAALLTALFIFPASLLRPLGGWLSDKFGARGLLYGVFLLMAACLFALSLPFGHIVFQVPDSYFPGGQLKALPYSMSVTTFTILIFLVGCAMGIGKAAVFKFIPDHFPNDVGAVGGLVGALGALGGFFLPLGFEAITTITHLPQSLFAILFLVTIISLIWLKVTVWKMLQLQQSPEAKGHY